MSLITCEISVVSHTHHITYHKGYYLEDFDNLTKDMTASQRVIILLIPIFKYSKTPLPSG